MISYAYDGGGDVEVDVAAGTQPNSKIRLEVRERQSGSDRAFFP
jgi:hypothetical protein